MSKLWHKEPKETIKTIKENMSLNDKGEVVQNFLVEYLSDVVLSNIIHDFELDSKTLNYQINKTLTFLYKKNRLSYPDEICKVFKDNCLKLLNNKQKYVLITSINFENTAKLKKDL